MSTASKPWFLFDSGSLWNESVKSEAEETNGRIEMDTRNFSETGNRCEQDNRSQPSNTHTLSSHHNNNSNAHESKDDQDNISVKKLLCYVLCLIAFMAISAVVFSFLETGHEKEQKIFWKGVLVDIRQELNISDANFKLLLVRLEGVKKYGLTEKSSWDFYNSFWFTMTITTTIGFGHITPVTAGGRLFCVFCGLLGIPLNALILKHVGNKIRVRVSRLIATIETGGLGQRFCKHVDIKCACVSFILMIFIILLGGCIDLMWEGWTFIDGIYFNFVALSTIGFGDIFPSVRKPSKFDTLGLSPTGKRFLASAIMVVYLTLGLSIVSSVVVSILTAMESVEKAKRKLVLSWKKRGGKNGNAGGAMYSGWNKKSTLASTTVPADSGHDSRSMSNGRYYNDVRF